MHIDEASRRGLLDGWLNKKHSLPKLSGRPDPLQQCPNNCRGAPALPGRADADLPPLLSGPCRSLCSFQSGPPTCAAGRAGPPPQVSSSLWSIAPAQLIGVLVLHNPPPTWDLPRSCHSRLARQQDHLRRRFLPRPKTPPRSFKKEVKTLVKYLEVRVLTVTLCSLLMCWEAACTCSGGGGCGRALAVASGSVLHLRLASALATYISLPRCLSSPQEDDRDFSDQWVICRWAALPCALPCRRAAMLPLLPAARANFWVGCALGSGSSTLQRFQVPCRIFMPCSVYNAGHEISNRYNEVRGKKG